MEISIDIIKELINIGMGDAAFSLSEIINAPVTIRVPEVSIINVKEVPDYLDREKKHLRVFIAQDFHGLLEGKVLISYSRACSISLLNALFGMAKDGVSLTSSDIATLQEIGNILIVSCLSTIGNMIQGILTFTMPQVITGISEQYFVNLTKELKDFKKCVLIKNELTIKTHDIQGYIFVLLSFKDLQIITARLQASAAAR